MLFTEWLEDKNQLLVEAEVAARTLVVMECIDLYLEEMGPEQMRALEIVRTGKKGDPGWEDAAKVLLDDMLTLGKKLIRARLGRSSELVDDTFSDFSLALWDYFSNEGPEGYRSIPDNIEGFVRMQVQRAAYHANDKAQKLVPVNQLIHRNREGDEVRPSEVGIGRKSRPSGADSSLDKIAAMQTGGKTAGRTGSEKGMPTDQSVPGGPLHQLRPDTQLVRKSLNDNLFRCIRALAHKDDNGRKSALVLLKIYGFEPRPGEDPMDVDSYEPGISDRNADYLRKGAKRAGTSDSIDEPATGTIVPKSKTMAAEELGLDRNEFNKREKEGRAFLQQCLQKLGIGGDDVGGRQARGEDE